MRVLLAAAFSLGLSCHHDQARPPAAGPAPAPQDEVACRACHGQWGPHGLTQEPSCLCRTHDAGKSCHDGLDCEGACVIVDARTEVTNPGPPPRGYFLGRCTEYDHLYGCHRFLEDGAHARGPVTLDEPVPELCVD
jgi:hypothetical protein